MMKSLFSAVLFISGCTVGGEVSDEAKNIDMICTDTRDGEVFEYNTSTVSDIRIGIAGTESSVSIITKKGEKRTFTSSQEAFIKCSRKD